MTVNVKFLFTSAREGVFEQSTMQTIMHLFCNYIYLLVALFYCKQPTDHVIIFSFSDRNIALSMIIHKQAHIQIDTGK